MPAVAIPNPAQIGSAGADPIYAAISIYIEFEEQASKVADVYDKAIELFNDEFGSTADLLSKERWSAWRERTGPSYDVFEHASNLWYDAAVGLLTTTPTSLAGVRALLSVVRERPLLFGFCEIYPDVAPQFVETLTIALARAQP
jgi:hypothetical protein